MSGSTDRRTVLAALAGVGVVGLGGCANTIASVADFPLPAPADLASLGLTALQFERGRALVAEHLTADLHAHPGGFFLEDDPDPTPLMKSFGTPAPDRSIAAMRAGGVGVVLFAAVADKRLLAPSRDKGLVPSRPFQPEEAWADYRRQIGVARRLVASGSVAPGLSSAGIRSAWRLGKVAAVMSVEGGDFIENDPSRVQVAYDDGVRSITIVHYTNNLIGDIQTDPRPNGRLTALGRVIVGEMQRLGLLVDLAHASPAVVRDVASIATRPVMISHTNLAAPNVSSLRLIDVDLAKAVAATGGVIGSVPSGVGQASFTDWIDSIVRLVDAVGAAHVGIGTDMDANYRPVFTDYALWPAVPGALLARGMSGADCVAVMGGSFMRTFAESVG